MEYLQYINIKHAIFVPFCRIDTEYDKEYSKCFSRTDVKKDLFELQFWKPRQAERRKYMVYYQHLKNLTITENNIKMLNCTNKKYKLDELCFDKGEIENKEKRTCNFTRIDNKNDSVELNP